MFQLGDYFGGNPLWNGSSWDGLAAMWAFVVSLLSWDIVQGGIVFVLAVYLVGLMVSRFSRALR